jgi:uncharacterized protein (TIGR02001 family)
MRSSLIGLTALALAGVASPVLAQDAPASDFTITGSAAITTDYRFRGISQSNEQFAVQGSATLTHSSGFYGSFWSSSIDDYVAAGSDTELDLIAGYSKTVSDVTLDGGLLYYVYANAAKGVNTDFLEIYGSAKTAFGPATVKGGFAYAPKQKAINAGFYTGHSKDDNLYLYGEVGYAIPDTGFALSSHIGYTHGRSLLTFGQKDYLDWNLGASYTFKNITIGVSYVDTDFKKNSLYISNASFAGFNAEDNTDATVLASITYAF